MTGVGDQLHSANHGLSPSLLDIWNLEKAASGGTIPHVVQDTIYNDVILAPDAPQPYVIKTPVCVPNPAEICYAESEVHHWMALASSQEPPPLQVAKCYWWNKDPAYISLQYLPGKTLHQALQERKGILTQAEQENLGRSLGSFVAWMATRLPVEDVGLYCGNILEAPMSSVMREAFRSIDHAKALGLHTVAKMLSHVKEISENRRQEIAHTSMIGHRDLHHGNILVDDKSMTPTAIIDFGSTGLSHPAYEMQALLITGSQVLSSAMQAYETATGELIDRELVEYWSGVRNLVDAFYCVRNGVPSGHQFVLEALFPEEDWTELAAGNLVNAKPAFSSAK